MATDSKNDMSFHQGSSYHVHYSWGKKTADGMEFDRDIGEWGTTNIAVPEDSAYTFMLGVLACVMLVMGFA